MTFIDSEEAVESFLHDVQGIITDKKFDLNKQLIFKMNRMQYSANNSYTNNGTLATLGYGLGDVANELLSLSVQEYKETFQDNKPNKINPFYCFIKTIQGKQVYIKIKIREENKRSIFCVSFHFAEKEVPDNLLPYKK